MIRRKDNNGKVLKDGESQRKDGRYQYRWTNKLGKRSIIYATSLKELREKEAEIQEKLNWSTTSTSKITVYQLAKRHLEETKLTIRPSSYKTKSQNLKIFQNHLIGEMNATDILVRDVKQFARELDNEGYCYTTIRDVMSLARPAFQEMFDENIIPRNPFVFKLNTIVKCDSKEKEILTEEQYQNLIKFMKSSRVYKRHVGMVMLLHETGLRAGELCGLTKKSFDFDNNTVTISHQMVYDGKSGGLYLAPTKTESGIRTIPLSKDAIIAFEEAIKQRPIVKAERIIDGQADFLFIAKTGRPYTNKNLVRIFEGLIKAYNSCHDEPLPEVTAHSMRHEYCTRLVKAKMDVKSVQYLMGHSSPDITLKVYTHILKEETEAEAIKQFNRIVS